ncbi:MAG: alpha/beta fold hydrolase [Alphaproteobacteria bacterium]|nr:alpha/beta fold hydrolase [Alphaproteobacteria bacterium]
MPDEAEEWTAETFMQFVMTPRRRARPRVAEPLRGAADFDIDTPTGKIAAWRLGEGPAILCVHGWEDDNALWGPFIDTCAQIGRAAVALDLPAHGFSEGEWCPAPDAASAIRAVADALGPIDALVAHSFGGPASVMAMTEGLEVKRAAFIACPLGRMRRWKRIGRELGVSDEIIEAARALYAQSFGARANIDVAEFAPSMRAQALYVHSADDEQVELSNSREAAAAWPGAELLVVDDLGHRLIAQEPAIIDRVVMFLDGA